MKLCQTEQEQLSSVLYVDIHAERKQEQHFRKKAGKEIAVQRYIDTGDSTIVTTQRRGQSYQSYARSNWRIQET